MKRVKWWEAFLAVLMSLLMISIIVIAFVSKNTDSNIQEDPTGESAQEQSDQAYIGFSAAATEELAYETMDTIEAKKLEKYSSKYAEFNSYIYYQALSGTERIIYNAFQYALDNNYQYILLDERLREESEYAVNDILRFLSLDSSVVEQNLVFKMSGDGNKGYRIYVENFTAEKMAKKEDAISKAREIVRQLDSNLTNTEKAQFFYDYLGENVTYVNIGDRDKKQIHYLYEALCLGQTNCDGFTNAFSLLCNIAEIPCFEKMWLPGNGEDGHTWNTLMLDGCWYNVDTTGAEEDVTDDYLLMRSLRRCFGYSDSLQTNTPMYEELIPSCERDLIPIACRFQTTEDPGICEAVKEAYAATTQKYVVISFEKGSAEGPLLQQIANALGCDIHREIRTGVGEQTIWYLFNNEGL